MLAYLTSVFVAPETETDVPDVPAEPLDPLVPDVPTVCPPTDIKA